MKNLWVANTKATAEMIEEFDENPNVFYRFQRKDLEMGTESWGMIYDNREEAIEDWMEDYECDREEAEEEAILPGKSCMDTLEGIMNYVCEFDSNYVLVAFYGTDTGVTGHDDEFVADVDEVAAVFDFDEICKFYED